MAGIVIGVLAVATATACGVYLFYRRLHPRSPLKIDENTNTAGVTPFSVFHRSSASMYTTPTSLSVQHEVTDSGESRSGEKYLPGRVLCTAGPDAASGGGGSLEVVLKVPGHRLRSLLRIMTGVLHFVQCGGRM